MSDDTIPWGERGPLERRRLIDRARKIRAGIEEIFQDAAGWNALHPTEPPIDCDPDGQLRRLADGLDRTLAAEAR